MNTMPLTVTRAKTPKQITMYVVPTYHLSAKKTVLNVHDTITGKLNFANNAHISAQKKHPPRYCIAKGVVKNY